MLPDGAAPPGDADPSFGILHGLYWLVTALAAERPQLLVVDGLHWGDGASVRFAQFLANRNDAVPDTHADQVPDTIPPALEMRPDSVGLYEIVQRD